jgi:hypothetical protein
MVDHGSRSVEIYNEPKELGRAERLWNGKGDDIYGEIAQDLGHLVGPRTLPWNSDRSLPDFDTVLLYEISAELAVLLYFGRTWHINDIFSLPRPIFAPEWRPTVNFPWATERSCLNQLWAPNKTDHTCKINYFLARRLFPRFRWSSCTFPTLRWLESIGSINSAMNKVSLAWMR